MSVFIYDVYIPGKSIQPGICISGEKWQLNYKKFFATNGTQENTGVPQTTRKAGYLVNSEINHDNSRFNSSNSPEIYRD